MTNSDIQRLQAKQGGFTALEANLEHDIELLVQQEVLAVKALVSYLRYAGFIVGLLGLCWLMLASFEEGDDTNLMQQLQDTFSELKGKKEKVEVPVLDEEITISINSGVSKRNTYGTI